MTSAILTIYDAFVAAPITVGSTTFTAKDADAIPNSLTTGILPLRLLSPIDLTGRENAENPPLITLGTGALGQYPGQVTWRIYDYMYYRPLAQGIGQRTVNAVLLGYMADYVAMVTDATRLVLPDTCYPENLLMSAEILEYPLQSGTWFYGVRCAVSIVEFL